jgi:hypothetical protein
MENKNSIKVLINPTWNVISEIRKKTADLLKDYDQSLLDATMMVASELMENAVKYGQAVPSESMIEFQLSVNGRITIKVTNGLTSEKDLLTVKIHIDKIKTSGDPGLLYTERLKELLENPKQGISQLGLYRIAYEGEFKLDYSYNDKLLTIIAQRDI